MEENRILLLDEERIKAKIRRMAYEIWEQNSLAKEIMLAGIEPGGLILARNLEILLKEISPLNVRTLPLKLKKSEPFDAEMPVKPEAGIPVILVDDVANSGRTLAYALRHLMEAYPSRVQVAVLIDRGHKSYPVSPDIVGHTLSTTLQEHVEVECAEGQVIAAYLK